MRAEKSFQSAGDGAAVRSVHRRVFRVVWRRAQSCPVRVGLRSRVAIRVGELDGPVWTPEPIVVLGIEAGNVADGPIPRRSQSVCHDTLPWLISFSLGNIDHKL